MADTDIVYTAQEFANKYQNLCKEMGYRIVVSPAYIGRDDGTFSTVLQYTIGELPKKLTEQQKNIS
jgi:hypothetical protein